MESDLAEALHREGKEGERSREDPDDEVAITLSETPTFTLLHIPGTVGEEEEDREAIQKANHTYQEVNTHIMRCTLLFLVFCSIFSFSRLVPATTATQ